VGKLKKFKAMRNIDNEEKNKSGEISEFIKFSCYQEFYKN